MTQDLSEFSPEKYNKFIEEIDTRCSRIALSESKLNQFQLDFRGINYRKIYKY